VVVRKEDQRALDTTLGIERIGTEEINLYSYETNPHISDDIFSARGCTPNGELDWAHHDNEIQRQHSPKLRSFVINTVNLTDHTDEHNMMQAKIILKKRQEIGSRSDHGLNTSAFHWELFIEHRLRPRAQVVSSEK